MDPFGDDNGIYILSMNIRSWIASLSVVVLSSNA